jgi:formyltetrahydrofolate deformylase
LVEPSGTYVLTLICPDRPGIVHSVSSFLVEQDCNILESQQFNDLDQDRFFMRVRFAGEPPVNLEALRDDFVPVASRFGMRWEMWDAVAPYRTLVLVSRSRHCLNDLLFRWRNGDVQIDVPLIVSNHLDCEPLAASHGVPFQHIPVTPETKVAAEAQILELVDELDIHLVVLARYMQVLSEDACKQLEGRAINIHHSFLPSFKGAKPYHQAFDRGVKLVGATAHYITPDLDSGPIIEQDVVRVDHSYDGQALAAAGRDVEAQVLSRAVRWHAESRVLLNGNKTVVFRN